MFTGRITAEFASRQTMTQLLAWLLGSGLSPLMSAECVDDEEQFRD
jgi:hypothetical protein